LAACLLKLGSYGFARCLLIFDFDLFKWFALVFLGGVLASLICFFQTDLKALVAYSSVVHITVLLGAIVILRDSAIFLVVILSLSHGFVSALLFLVVGQIREMSGSRSLIIVRSGVE